MEIPVTSVATHIVSVCMLAGLLPPMMILMTGSLQPQFVDWVPEKLISLLSGSCQLFVLRHRRLMFGRRAFSVAGPAAWNLLPDYLRDPTHSFDSFCPGLKTFLFSLY